MTICKLWQYFEILDAPTIFHGDMYAPVIFHKYLHYENSFYEDIRVVMEVHGDLHIMTIIWFF